MTQAELIAALPEGRLPPSLMALHATDLVALFGLGLLLGALCCALVLPLLVRRVPLRARLRAIRSLEPEARLLAIARILGRLPDDLRAAAYGAAPPPGDEAIERIALKARRARR
ncbi:hypothetical protein [Xanthobacter flavus]|uniref:hypothetical protein n=1 Tax=Xanthobacter flavus TaxID=281 RepID=UPI001AE7841A|nr:hypothetical protein [Xanthobacter flavus]MBP2150937.1 hypothetical protein [Xanthobacter flavus]